MGTTTSRSATAKNPPKKGSSSVGKTTKRRGHPELTIGMVGFFLSITLHELLHLILHWHQITGIRFFPNFYTIAEFVVRLPEGYDLSSEEFIAYAISAGTLVVTAGIIAKVHDKNDKRTASQILFPERYRIRSNTQKK